VQGHVAEVRVPVVEALEVPPVEEQLAVEVPVVEELAVEVPPDEELAGEQLAVEVPTVEELEMEVKVGDFVTAVIGTKWYDASVLAFKKKQCCCPS
jgi:hypothetical protein